MLLRQTTDTIAPSNFITEVQWKDSEGKKYYDAVITGMNLDSLISSNAGLCFDSIDSMFDDYFPLYTILSDNASIFFSTGDQDAI